MAAYKSDIEIAQECKMRPIFEIAKVAGIDEKYIEQYGRYKAKVDLSLLDEVKRPESAGALHRHRFRSAGHDDRMI